MQQHITNNFGTPLIIGIRTKLFSNEILFFEGDVNYTWIHFKSGKQRVIARTLLYIEQKTNTEKVMAELDYATEFLKNEKISKKSDFGLNSDYNGRLPLKVTRTALRDNRLKNVFDTYTEINVETNLAKKYFSSAQNNLKPYLDKIYAESLEAYKNQIAQAFSKVVMNLEKNIKYYKEQLVFVNYEIIEARKKLILNKIVTKSEESKRTDKPDGRDESRSDYEDKGLRYWPFQGEFWEDEIGNYQYFGENLCAHE